MLMRYPSCPNQILEMWKLYCRKWTKAFAAQEISMKLEKSISYENNIIILILHSFTLSYAQNNRVLLINMQFRWNMYTFLCFVALQVNIKYSLVGIILTHILLKFALNLFVLHPFLCFQEFLWSNLFGKRFFFLVCVFHRIPSSN